MSGSRGLRRAIDACHRLLTRSAARLAVLPPGPLGPNDIAELIRLRERDPDAFAGHLATLVQRRRWKDALPLLALVATEDDAAREPFITGLQQLGIPGNLDELALLRLLRSGHIKLPEKARLALKDQVDLDDPPVQLAVLRTLFAFEIARGTFFHVPTKTTATFFLRGNRDVLRAERSGKPMVDRESPRYLEARHHLDVVLPESLFADGPPRRVCEIGAAWGGSSLSIIDRFSPEEFVNFEIDSDLARRMETELGMRSLPCDGETLTGVEDGSMDLVFASGVLYFVPPMKLVSYFNEMVRVCRPGGLVYFNILTAEQLSPRRMALMAKDASLRRTFAPAPLSWIEDIFAGFERLPVPDKCGFDPKGEFIFRKPGA